MIQRFYVHNFRCLENFELPIAKRPSTLLVGRNGSGKSTVGLALEVLQKIARGTNRVGDLVRPADFSRGRSDVPLRFEIELVLDEKRSYEYCLRWIYHRVSGNSASLKRDCRSAANIFMRGK